MKIKTANDTIPCHLNIRDVSDMETKILCNKVKLKLCLPKERESKARGQHVAAVLAKHVQVRPQELICLCEQQDQPPKDKLS